MPGKPQPLLHVFNVSLLRQTTLFDHAPQNEAVVLWQRLTQFTFSVAILVGLAAAAYYVFGLA